MFVGHSRPSGGTWSVSGTGAAILSDASNLEDGRPDTLTAMRWLSGTQNTSSVFRLRYDWTSGAIVPRLVGLSNLSLPAGTKVTASFRRAGDTAGTYPYTPTAYNATQRIVEGPAGERTAWIMLPDGATPVVGVEIQIWNDVNGVASIPASQQFTNGEAWVSGGTDVPIATTPTMTTIDPTVTNWSTNNQPYTVPGTPYRQFQFALATANIATWRNVYAPLLAKINRGARCFYCVSLYDRPGAAFSAEALHADGLIGVSTALPQRKHNQVGIWDSGTCSVTESPIPT